MSIDSDKMTTVIVLTGYWPGEKWADLDKLYLEAFILW